MIYFLILASTYESVRVALCSDESIIASASVSKQTASSELMPTIAALLQAHGRTLTDVQFCVVNQGPGPFTTIRTVIATANGLNFASKVPLVGANDLIACLDEYQAHNNVQSVALYNAFNHDVYLGIRDAQSNAVVECIPIEKSLSLIADRYLQDSIHIVGNGAIVYRDQLQNYFGDRLVIPDPLPQSSSLQQLHAVGLRQWQENNNVCAQMQPLYLKTVKAAQ
jgi:tRNA threonylcarbamoyladenosine biosynthesis protein TsaB